MTNPVAAGGSTRRLALWCTLLVAVLAAWNLREVAGYPLVVWDDDVNLSLNPYLGAPTVPRLHWMFTDVAYMRRYMPLGWLGFSTVYAGSGLSGAGYHTANLMLHVANSALLFGVLWVALRRWQPASNRWGAAAAALATSLWSLHPFRVETVGWASGLVYSLAGCFALLSVFAYLGLAGWRRYGCTALFYLAAILTYPIAVGCWGIYVLIDVADRQRGRVGLDARSTRRLLVWKLGLLVPALAVAAIELFARLQANEFWGAAPSLDDLSLTTRVLRAVAAVAYYVRKLVWPVDLTPMPTASMNFSPLAAGAVIAVTAVLVASVALAMRPNWRRGPLLFWLGFLGLLVPTLGFTEQWFFPCDRYAYLPAMVASAALAAGLIRVPAPARRFAAILVLGALAWLAARQRVQAVHWRDTDALYTRIVQAADNPAIVAGVDARWIKLHLQRWNLERAGALLASAREAFPGDAKLASLAADFPRYAAARRELERGGDIPPDLPTVPTLHVGVARAYVRRGEFREADEQFEQALHWAPRYAMARYDYAVACAISGRPAEALHRYLGVMADRPPSISVEAERRALALIAAAFEAARQPVDAGRVRAYAVRLER
jgi:hypothetical protein